MVEQKSVDKTFQDLADKIQAELPEELSLATHFSVDEKHERLLLDFAVHLEKNDYPLVLGIVKKFNGDFGNRKEGGKDVGYFFVPKPKLVDPAPSTPAEVKPAQEKKPEVPKQPSPISQFVTNYCEFCADCGDKCNSTTVSGREVRMICLRILSVKELQSFNEICRNFIKLLVSRALRRFNHLQLLRLSSHSLKRCIGIRIRLKATRKAISSGLMLRIKRARRLRRHLLRIIRVLMITGYCMAG